MNRSRASRLTATGLRAVATTVAALHLFACASSTAGGRRDAGRVTGDAGPLMSLDARPLRDRFMPDVPPGTPRCKAGHYVGSFEGVYRSQLWPEFLGTPEIMVSAVPNLLNGGEGLEFDLVERSDYECAPNEEFCFDFGIEGGRITGNADWFPLVGALLPVPFEMDLEGELDCENGVMRALLSNGHYEFAIALQIQFSGTASAEYVPYEYRFENGLWDLDEVPPMLPVDPMPGDWDDFIYESFKLIPIEMAPPNGFGGEGTWEATLVEPAP